MIASLIDKAFPLRGYIDARSAKTYRATEWLDAVPARDAVPGEGKVVAKRPDEV